jgi:hypothetical protein
MLRAVPVEPTEAMLEAGLYDAEGFNLLGISVDALREAYIRMVKAAPDDRMLVPGELLL